MKDYNRTKNNFISAVFIRIFELSCFLEELSFSDLLIIENTDKRYKISTKINRATKDIFEYYRKSRLSLKRR